MKNEKSDIKSLLALVNRCFTLQSDPYTPTEVRKRISDNYLHLMLNNSSLRLIKCFYLEHVESILKQSFLKPIHGSEKERLDAMSLKIGGLQLISILYAKAPKDDVHYQGSALTKKVFQFLKDNRRISVDASFNGKEMSQFLVKQLKKSRSEIIDGSTKVQECFRVCQCEAFNAMMAVISCIQDQEKFYNAFIFKEDVGSSEFIWERIIDQSQEMCFPLEMEDVGQRRSKIVAIRKVGSRSQDQEIRRLSGGHYLSDSSVSQDVTTFDFHDSLATLQLSSQSIESENKSLNGKFIQYHMNQGLEKISEEII